MSFLSVISRLTTTAVGGLVGLAILTDDGNNSEHLWSDPGDGLEFLPYYDDGGGAEIDPGGHIHIDPNIVPGFYISSGLDIDL